MPFSLVWFSTTFVDCVLWVQKLEERVVMSVGNGGCRGCECMGVEL